MSDELAIAGAAALVVAAALAARTPRSPLSPRADEEPDEEPIGRRHRTIRITSRDVSATSRTVYRYHGLGARDAVASVEVRAMQVQLRRRLTHPGDRIILNDVSVPLAPHDEAEALVRHVSELGATIVEGFAMTTCDGREWTAVADEPFVLAFAGAAAHVLGAGPFRSSASPQGGEAVRPKPIDASLARTVTVSADELGAGDEAIVASMLVDRNSDVAPHDGRSDPHEADRPVATRALTLRFAVRHVDGADAPAEELVGWSAVVRLGLERARADPLAPTPVPRIVNNYTAGDRSRGLALG